MSRLKAHLLAIRDWWNADAGGWPTAIILLVGFAFIVWELNR